MIVATIKADSILIQGKVGENILQMMLNTGSSVSLLHQDSLSTMADIRQLPRMPAVDLVTAAGLSLHITDYVEAPVQIGGTKVRQW